MSLSLAFWIVYKVWLVRNVSLWTLVRPLSTQVASLWPWSSTSCPSVEMLRCLNALESVKVLLIDVNGLRVSSAEALSNPCVVQALSVTESEVAYPAADGCTEEDAWEGEHNVGVEWDWVKTGLGAEVPAPEGSTSNCEAEPAIATENLVTSREVGDRYVEEIGVVLDEIDRSNSLWKILISLWGGMRVCILMTVVVVAIVTHIYYTLIYIISFKHNNNSKREPPSYLRGL